MWWAAIAGPMIAYYVIVAHREYKRFCPCVWRVAVQSPCSIILSILFVENRTIYVSENEEFCADNFAEFGLHCR